MVLRRALPCNNWSKMGNCSLNKLLSSLFICKVSACVVIFGVGVVGVFSLSENLQADQTEMQKKEKAIYRFM
jgi:hypothetical protein